MHPFLLKPNELIMFQNELQTVQIQSQSSQPINVSLNVISKKTDQYQFVDNSGQYFQLNKLRILLHPGDTIDFQVNFIPPQDTEKQLFVGKVILQTDVGNFQLNLLGIYGTCKLEKYNNGIINSGTVPVFAKNLATKEVYLLQKGAFTALKQDCRIIYGNIYLKYISQQQQGQQQKDIFDFYQSLKFNTDILDLITEKIDFLDYFTNQQAKQGSNLYESINFTDIRNTQQHQASQYQPSQAINPFQPVPVQVNVNSVQNNTLSQNNLGYDYKHEQQTQFQQTLLNPEGYNDINHQNQQISNRQQQNQNSNQQYRNNVENNKLTEYQQNIQQSQAAIQPYQPFEPEQQKQQLNEKVNQIYNKNQQINQLVDNYLSQNPQEDDSINQQHSQVENKEPAEPVSPSTMMNNNDDDELMQLYKKEYNEYKNLQKHVKKLDNKDSYISKYADFNSNAILIENDTMQQRYVDLPHCNIVYERDIIPELMPVSVQYVDKVVSSTTQNNKYLTKAPFLFENAPMYHDASSLCFWRVFNSEFLLNSCPNYLKLGDENVEVGIWQLQGQIIIQNDGDQDAFQISMEKLYGKTIEQKYQNMDIHQNVLNDEILDSIDKLSNLYYQVQFITTDKQFSNFRIQIKTEDPLIGKLKTGEMKCLNISVGIVVSDSELNDLPEIPKVFNDKFYVRVFGLRCDRFYSDEDLQTLPLFVYEKQFDNEYLEAVDLPVKFGNNIVNEVALNGNNQILKGDNRADRFSESPRYLGLNVKFLNFMQILPVIQKLDSVIDLGMITLQRDIDVPKIVQEKSMMDQVKAEVKKMSKQQKKQSQQYTPQSAPKTTKMYIQTSEDDNQQNLIQQIYNIIIRHKAIDYSAFQVEKLVVQIYPTNLPNIDEFNRLQQEGFKMSHTMPVMSNCFITKFKQNTKSISQLIINCSEIFQSQDYLVAKLQIRFKLQQQLKNILMQIMQTESQLRLPLQIEQKFEISISTYQSNFNAIYTQPILIKCRLQLDDSIQMQTPPTRQLNIDNHLLGINIKQTNGYIDQLFTDVFNVELPLCYINDQSEMVIQLFNASNKQIVGFCHSIAKPFKTQTSFSVNASSQFKLQLVFQGQQCGEYTCQMKIQWNDVSQLTQKKQVERNQSNKATNFKSFTVSVKALCLNIPIILSQHNRSNLNINSNSSHIIKIIKSQQNTFLELKNITNTTVNFFIKCEEFVVGMPMNGVLEPLGEGQIRLAWKDILKMRVGHNEPFFLYAEIGNRRICCFEGIAQVAED